jgi:hypothetical protein
MGVPSWSDEASAVEPPRRGFFIGLRLRADIKRCNQNEARVHDARLMPAKYVRPWPASSQHDDLLPQHENLGLQGRARPQQIDDNPNNYSAEIQHSAEDHRILPSRQLYGIYDWDRYYP